MVPQDIGKSFQFWPRWLPAASREDNNNLLVRLL
jgi:hypothetical protein